jgi:hypothetical protein
MLDRKSSRQAGGMLGPKPSTTADARHNSESSDGRRPRRPANTCRWRARIGEQVLGRRKARVIPSTAADTRYNSGSRDSGWPSGPASTGRFSLVGRRHGALPSTATSRTRSHLAMLCARDKPLQWGQRPASTHETLGAGQRTTVSLDSRATQGPGQQQSYRNLADSDRDPGLSPVPQMTEPRPFSEPSWYANHSTMEKPSWPSSKDAGLCWVRTRN